MAELRPNKAKRKLQRGEIVAGVMGFNSADMIDSVGPSDIDVIWIEAEHGPVDFADIPDMTRACDLWGMTSVVRVNQNVPGVIYRTLDVGAQGICVPHVNTAEEAQAVVEAAKYAPLGSRGHFTSRQGYGVADYVSKANDETLLIILIEDIVAVNNLAEILTVDNIDVFYVAPGDLAQSMGLLGQMRHPDLLGTIDRSVEQIVAAGRTAGCLVTEATIEHYVSKGARYFTTSCQPWIAAGIRGFQDKVASLST